MNQFIAAIRNFLSERFNLNEDKEEESLIKENIKRETHFKGTNLWTLIFAIFIASIGLNVNSTAVVIGAMLISPLMGPIMGVGLGIAINDFELLKKGIKNVAIAVIISIATSFLYFSLTPLHDANSELLARTNPSVWDVFIAFLGGLAGIVASTRREKSNVIPGVAIATALMPPLCTAGFGLATGKWYYFLGALYLFFINSLFICLATFLIVKHMRFRKTEQSSPEREKRISRYIFLLVAITVLPSIYLAYRIVQRSIFESNAKRFVQDEFHFSKTQVVTHNFRWEEGNRSVELLLVGQPLPDSFIEKVRSKMPGYGLTRTRLVVHQGLDAKQRIDLSEIKASVVEEIFASRQARDTLPELPDREEPTVPDLKQELKALYPTLRAYALNKAVLLQADSNKQDTITYFIGTFARPLPAKDRSRLRAWLRQRIAADSVRMIFD